jgi:hypothetical protein
MLESDPSEKLLVGDWEILPETMLRGIHGLKMARPRYPEAGAVLEIAAAHGDHNELPHPDEVRPRYLRDPDVRVNWADFRTEGPWAP